MTPCPSLALRTSGRETRTSGGFGGALGGGWRLQPVRARGDASSTQIRARRCMVFLGWGSGGAAVRVQAPAALGVAEDAVKDDVDDVLGRLGGGAVTAG